MWAQMYSAQRHNPNVPKLYDLGHPSEPIMKKFSKWYFLVNYLIYIEIFFLLFTTNPLLIARANTLMNITRSVCFNLTTLPQCGKNNNTTKVYRSPAVALWNYLSLQDRDLGYNNDLLFSGHAAFFLINIYYVLQYYHNYWLYCGGIIILNSWACIVAVLSGRHYSIDIYVAIPFTWCCYSILC
jgi:hypothetical protein